MSIGNGKTSEKMFMLVFYPSNFSILSIFFNAWNHLKCFTLCWYLIFNYKLAKLNIFPVIRWASIMCRSENLLLLKFFYFLPIKSFSKFQSKMRKFYVLDLSRVPRATPELLQKADIVPGGEVKFTFACTKGFDTFTPQIRDVRLLLSTWNLSGLIFELQIILGWQWYRTNASCFASSLIVSLLHLNSVFNDLCN